jgi:hypothetical protein
MATLTITHGAGDPLVFDQRWRITDDELSFDVQSSRPPMSDVWFRYGTFKQISGRLGLKLDFTLKQFNVTMEKIEAIMDALESISSVAVDGRSRQVYGLSSISTIPTETGISIQCALHCREGDWQAGSEVAFNNIGSGIRLRGVGDNLLLFAHLPSEAQTIQRAIDATPQGMVERGDGRRNPSNLTLRCLAIGNSPEQAWATMVRITQLARTVNALVVSGRTIPIFGCRRISRAYTGYTKIEIEMELLPGGTVYPLGVARILQENTSVFIIEQEDGSAIELE